MPKFYVRFDTMLLWKRCLSIGMLMLAKICLYINITYLCQMTGPSFTDESCVDKIDERNRFPYEICVSHYRGHPIPRVSQLPNIYTMVFSDT
jgi:hypothetical protein